MLGGLRVLFFSFISSFLGEAGRPSLFECGGVDFLVLCFVIITIGVWCCYWVFGSLL